MPDKMEEGRDTDVSMVKRMTDNDMQDDGDGRRVKQKKE